MNVKKIPLDLLLAKGGITKNKMKINTEIGEEEDVCE